jgi:capsular polysaccharide biosynthesis protein
MRSVGAAGCCEVFVEIGDYLRVIRRRLWILVLVPVLATGIVGALLLLQPPRYRAVATVAAPALVGGSADNQYSGAAGARIFVANFAAALTAPQVLAKVAEQTQTLEQDLQDGLSAQPIQESSLVQVTYLDTDRARAALVAEAASSVTIRFLFQSQVDLARRSVNTADKGVSDLKDKLEASIAKTGILDPEQRYEQEEQQLLSLEQRQDLALAEGNTTVASGLGEAINDKQAELKRLVPLVTSYQDLVQQRDDAVSRRDELQRRLEGLLAQARAVDPKSVVSVSEPERQSRLMAFVRQGGVAFAAGLLLAIAIVFLLTRGVAEQLGEVRRRLDKLDPGAIAVAAADRFWSSRLPHLSGQLLALEEIGDNTLVQKRPGAVCRLRQREDRLQVLLGDRVLHMPEHLAPAMQAILTSERLAVADLAGHLDPPSRLLLVRRLVREGLLESVPLD